MLVILLLSINIPTSTFREFFFNNHKASFYLFRVQFILQNTFMYAKYPSPLNTGIWQRIHFVFNKPIYEYNFKVYYEY